MPAMLTPYRLIAPLLATALVALPTTQAQAAAFAHMSAAEEAPSEAPDAAPAGDDASQAPEGAEGAEGEGADGAAEGEGAEGEGAEGEGAEAAPEEPAPEPEPEPEPEPVAEAAPPMLPEGPERPPEPMIAGKPAKGKGMMIAGGVLLGGGIAATITSIFLTSCPEPANTVGCKYATHRTLAVPIAGSVTLVGGLLLGVGIAYAVRYKKWQRWKPEDDKKIKKTAFVPTFMPGGAGVGYVGRF